MLPVPIPRAEIISFFPAIPEPFYQASAGFGDSLTLGATRFARSHFTPLGMRDSIKEYSYAYVGGEAAAVAVSLGRVGYAATARALPLLLKSATEIETARRVFSARNNLKRIARLGLFPNYRVYTMESLMKKYGGNTKSIIAASTRTDMRVNALAGMSAVKTISERRSSKKKSSTGHTGENP